MVPRRRLLETEVRLGYEPKTNLVKDERGDLLADPQKILTRWKNYFCQLLNVQGQTEILTAEPFVPEPSAAEVSRQPLTTAARVTPCEICAGQSDAGLGFSVSSSLFPIQ
jgi:hypothetical protein